MKNSNVNDRERRQLERLKVLMRERCHSQRQAGIFFGISRSAVQEMLQCFYIPKKKDRGEILNKIGQLILELEHGKTIVVRDKSSFQGVDQMELLSKDTMEVFGLKRDPFVNEIRGVRDVFDLSECKRAYNFLMKIARGYGFGALIGEVGSGKTLLFRRLVEDLKRENIRFVQAQTINKQRLQYSHILDALFSDLTGKSLGGGGRSIEIKSRNVRDLLQQAIYDDQRVCLVIDDAHQMPRETLRCLKQLYDYVIGFSRQLGILLLGQLELVEVMRDVRLKETTQRCAYFFMQGLVAPGMVEKYLKFKFSKAGCNGRDIFERNVFKLIERHNTIIYEFEGKKKRICPQLRVQNLAAMLMNRTVELGEKLVTREIVGEILGR